MTRLAGNARISFEGGSSVQGLTVLEGASEEETDLLHRNTTWPRQQFVIVPLETPNLQSIWKAIGGTLSRDILHIQIEKEGHLAFSAYDRFHPDCVVFGPSIEPEFIESLIEQRLLERSHRQPL